MSFIHDALKKSEAERQRLAGPALLEMRIVRPQRRLPGWAIAVGVLLVVNVGVLGWLALRPGPKTAAAVTAPAATPVAVAAAPAATSLPAPVGDPALATVTLPGNAAAPPPATILDAQDGTRSSGTGGIATESNDNPADLEPAVAPTPGSVTVANSANVHSYAELSGKLPELRLDLHVYAANAADRYAFINMHKVHEGEVTPEGVQVREITREGVVLEYHGTEFLLGRE